MASITNINYSKAFLQGEMALNAFGYVNHEVCLLFNFKEPPENESLEVLKCSPSI